MSNLFFTFCQTALLASNTILPPALPLPAVPSSALRFRDHLDQNDKETDRSAENVRKTKKRKRCDDRKERGDCAEKKRKRR